MYDRILIEGEQPFFVSKGRFTLSEAQGAYTLQSSVDYDPENPEIATWANYSDTIPADKPHMIEANPGLFWRLLGNTGRVYLRF